MSDSLAGINAMLRAQARRQRLRQERSAIAVLLVLAVAVFGGGITWGLPSRDADVFLFGRRPVWSGRQILDLAGPRTTASDQGADIDRNPLDRHRKLVLNQTDAERAQIVRRYRLFTSQPDEMVTLMALAEMHPGRGGFDPKLYQYGGLWVYPIGVMLRVAGWLHLIQFTPNLEFYLDHPDAFGRFYIVARLYVAAWAMLGAWAVFVLTRRLSRGSLLAACVACFCYIMLPVVVNMSHEAKPHLAGAVLMLLTALAADKYVRTAEPRWFGAAAVLAGCALGIVLAAWPALIILPVAAALVRQTWTSRVKLLSIGWAASLAVYFATNPYVLVHLFNNRPLLRSNLGNTRAMFHLGLSGQGLLNAFTLIGEGASTTIAVCGALAILTLGMLAARRRRWAVHHSGWLLIGPAVVIALQFVLFAEGQPGEYGRFAIFLDLVLLIAAVVGAREVLEWREWCPELIVLLGMAAGVAGSRYYAGFVGDAQGPSSRLLAAQLIDAYARAGARTIGLVAEPAPYSVPPLNLFKPRIVLLPKDYDPAGDPDPPDLVVRAVDTAEPPSVDWAAGYDWEFVNPVTDVRRMQWAAKPFLILRRR